MSSARQILDKQITEREFQNQVIALANLHGWKVHHHFNSRKSEPGWPDLVCVHQYDTTRPVIFAELKTEKGKPTPAQLFWLERLDCGEAMEDYIVVRLWRPSDFDEIAALLAG